MKEDKQLFKGENTPKDYIVVRCQLVHVKKKLVFFTEKELGFRIVIPDTKYQAAELMAKILVACDSYGKAIKVA